MKKKKKQQQQKIRQSKMNLNATELSKWRASFMLYAFYVACFSPSLSVSLSFPSDKVFAFAIAIVFVLCAVLYGLCRSRTVHAVLFFLYGHSIVVNVFRIALTNAVHLLFGSFRMCLYLDFTQRIHNIVRSIFLCCHFHLFRLHCVCSTLTLHAPVL